MQPVSERNRLSSPRYRVEERVPNLAAIIVGFADTPRQYRTLLTLRASQLTRARSSAELVVIDQESEAIVVRRDVWESQSPSRGASRWMRVQGGTSHPGEETVSAGTSLTAKRRQVPRLRASPVGVCSTFRVRNWVPFASGVK
jgi:hypothetical protein